MAYGVDRYPDPPEAPDGHWEYDQDDNGEMIRVWVQDFDEDGNEIQEDDDEQ